ILHNQPSHFTVCRLFVFTPSNHSLNSPASSCISIRLATYRKPESQRDASGCESSRTRPGTLFHLTISAPYERRCHSRVASYVLLDSMRRDFQRSLRKLPDG